MTEDGRRQAAQSAPYPEFEIHAHGQGPSPPCWPSCTSQGSEQGSASAWNPWLPGGPQKPPCLARLRNAADCLDARPSRQPPPHPSRPWPDLALRQVCCALRTVRRPRPVLGGKVAVEAALGARSPADGPWTVLPAASLETHTVNAGARARSEFPVHWIGSSKFALAATWTRGPTQTPARPPVPRLPFRLAVSNCLFGQSTTNYLPACRLKPEPAGQKRNTDAHSAHASGTSLRSLAGSRQPSLCALEPSPPHRGAASPSRQPRNACWLARAALPMLIGHDDSWPSSHIEKTLRPIRRARWPRENTTFCPLPVQSCPSSSPVTDHASQSVPPAGIEGPARAGPGVVASSALQPLAPHPFPVFTKAERP
ncbi:hypothetical protein PCL_00235 [Purpureocillium lilacinum]|uniref:Uncharacterized protein n=1 Tax=Purpureocillium lilacinum TaxID=33203 RepID=A0A2U3E6E6_PURLI|nr:hypothetical protein Purlil1_13064 [Purpureocillium lilacinum]PWI70091.1 hypothetical protein PCL_00235 [Purpureocillium lilacinum]